MTSDTWVDLVAQIANLAIRPATHVTHSDLEDLGQLIARRLDLPLDDDTYLRLSPGSSLGWSAETLASRVVELARARDATEVLVSLERAIATNTAEVSEVVVLWGLHPRETVDLGRGMQLVPLSALPPSTPRDILLGVGEHEAHLQGGYHVLARPRAALVHTFTFGPVLVQRTAGLPHELGGMSRQAEMLDIARCLTLATPHSVRHIGSWFHGPEAHPLFPHVAAWDGQAVTWGDQFEVSPEDLDAEALRALVDGYIRLSKRDRLRIVLDRLNAAKSRQSLEDRAVDLGVALEALLFNSGDAPTEISLKLKLRGAVLASSDPDERKQAFRLLDRLYTLRSTAAHGGTFDREDSVIGRDLRDGLLLATELVRRVLRMRRLPESWNGLILGWESLPDV